MNCSCNLIYWAADRIPFAAQFFSPARLRLAWVLVVAYLCCPSGAIAQSISSIQPRTGKPGQTVELRVAGTKLDDSLRLISSTPAVQWKVKEVTPKLATLTMTLPKDVALGPMSLWFGTSSGSVKPHQFLIDDLNLAIDNNQNHSQPTAQTVPVGSTVEGFCNGSQSDYYHISVDAGQRVAFQVHTQQLRSQMDPVVRLLDSTGETLIEVDDTAVGPDCQFSYDFLAEGDYWIELHDSRHAANGAAYQLRIGDFPILQQCYPLTVTSGQSARVAFSGEDGSRVPVRDIEIPPSKRGTLFVPARFEKESEATWLPLNCSPYRQHVEHSDGQGNGEVQATSLSLPVGISGRLEQPGEVDSYLIQGQKGQTVKVSAKTRSLGSPTLLQMRIYNAAGEQIAQTQVSDTDEWSFDAKLTETGDYRLEVNDLLHRGGQAFAYYVECVTWGTFSVALKADVKTREEYMIEPQHGACALDLQIARFGYDGAIDLALDDSNSGLRIINPRIPGKAAQARIYITATDHWRSDSLATLRLTATAVDAPEQTCQVSSRALRRIKEPFVIAPTSQADGVVVLNGAPATDTPFTMQPLEPLQFARPTLVHTAVLSPKRLQEKFKAGVEVLASGRTPDWEVKTKVEKEEYTLTLSHSDQVAEQPEQLALQFFGEFNGHGRIETCELPIQWIDPIQVSISFDRPLLLGCSAVAKVRLQRDGNDPQPVTISPESLPEGISVQESITIAADQDRGQLQLKIAENASTGHALELSLQATSQYAGQEFTVGSTHPLPQLVAPPRSLTVYPNQIVFSESRGRQQVAVTGIDHEGRLRDWTTQARFTSTDPEVAEVRGGVVYPLADGKTDIVVALGEHRKRIPLVASNVNRPRRVDFESEVLVALSKQGCNSGACHGSPSGKGGFRLSLRAFDKALDELTLIREEAGRRTNSLEPEKSLLLQKPLMKVAHGGGRQLRQDDEAYRVLRDWIASGGRTDPAETPRVTKLEVYPNQKRILSLRDGGQQLVVTAHFADGRQRDVTHLAAYETSDTAVATVDVNGLVTPHERGEVAILVRLLEYIESVPLMFVEELEGFQWKAPPPENYVDKLVNAKLRQLHYLPSQTCTDSEFLRRVSLDLLGILPSVEETTAFLASTDPRKRQRLIDELLQREEFAKFWALKWGDLLQMTGKMVGDEGVFKYHRWVEQALDENMPYDEFAKELLTGTGSTLANPPANFYRTANDMNQCVETISQVFLGARLQCAKCHNHPFERWTQDNYYGLGAFFNRVKRRKTDRPGEMFVYVSASGDVTQPRTGQVMAPWLPQKGSIETQEEADRREAFAQWLVDPNNPYFARIEANRIWSQLFARGIVDPIDDFRDSNPPANAALLDALADDFVNSGYDRKQLLRVILNSRTYQASYQTNQYNEHDTKYFSHQQPRLLSAEQLLDAINRTLALRQKLGDLPDGTLATQLPAPDVVKVDFLKVFGQPERSTVCACERADDSNLGMAIELFNGQVIHDKLQDESNRFHQSLAHGRAIDEVIQELYLAAVCRRPSETEMKTALAHCKASPSADDGLEDLCWALFNTDEFLFQH